MLELTLIELLIQDKGRELYHYNFRNF